MNRAVRDRLIDLLLRAFRDQRAGDAIRCLGLYWELRLNECRGDVTLAELETRWAERYPSRVVHARDRAAAVAALKGILRLRPHVDVRERIAVRFPRYPGDSLLVEPHPATLPYLPGLREHTERYRQVIETSVVRKAALDRMPALHRTVAEAALCFNAGLFFEAHEHLEHHWVRLTGGSDRRILQGLIQISVGCHHAARGSYDGTVNQFGKGLAKLAGAPGEVLGLHAARLLRETEELRQKIVTRGRGGMRPVSLEDIPRMHLAV